MRKNEGFASLFAPNLLRFFDKSCQGDEALCLHRGRPDKTHPASERYLLAKSTRYHFATLEDNHSGLFLSTMIVVRHNISKTDSYMTYLSDETSVSTGDDETDQN